MIDSEYFWTNVVFLAIGTLCIRASVIAIASRVTISARLKEIFSYIPAAILPAFIAPAVYFHQGHVEWALGKERMLILILTVPVCYFTRSTLATIGFGLTALYVVSQVV